MKNFEICVRGIILRKDKILICKLKREDFYFLPGGHLKFDETIERALFREFKEELGILIKKFSFIGIVENIFFLQKKKVPRIQFRF